MSCRAEFDSKQTVKCRSCKEEYILIWEKRKPNQKWGDPKDCPYCTEKK